MRREITAQGRSRAFIDGQLATAGALRDLAAALVELHGQHEHQALMQPETHLPLVDTWAGLEPEAARVATAWAALSQRARAPRPGEHGHRASAPLASNWSSSS